MAERVTQKSKRPTAAPRQVGRVAPAVAKRAPAESKRAPGGQVAALEKERDQLKAQLAAAQAQIVKLEQAREEAVLRIDWALDSLHNLLESDA